MMALGVLQISRAHGSTIEEPLLRRPLWVMQFPCVSASTQLLAEELVEVNTGSSTSFT